MVEDILDKIVVPNVKSTKGDVFKKDKEEKKEKVEYKKEEKREDDKPKYYLHEKKDVFKRGEFDTRKPVSFNIKAPGLVERSIYILIILVLIYFAFFKNINLNIDFGDIFKGDIKPLAVKSVENKTTTTPTTTEKKEETKVEEKKETQLSGEITLTIDKVNTEKYDTGVSKITGFTFTVDNQKEAFDGKLVYYAYDSSTPAIWKTKARGYSTFLMLIGLTTNTVDINPKITFSSSSTKTLRVELLNKDATIANITKEVQIS